MDSSIGSCGSNSIGCDGCLFGGKTPLPTISTNVFDKNVACTRDAPVPPPTLSDDAMLAKELNELTFEERELISDDIHGVRGDVEETPEFIELLIAELNRELSELPRGRRQALDRAVFLKPSIETDVKFKLMFLRADCYDYFKAARRLAKFFEHKILVFGEEKLVKKITLDDFTEEDMEVFKTGPFLHLGSNDAAGRPIWLSNASKYDFSRVKSLLRCAWYMMMTGLLEDEATQIKGVCNVVFGTSDIKLKVTIPQFLQMLMKEGEIVQNLPVRPACSHFCYDNATMEFMLSGLRRAFGKTHRLRLRAHYGSGVEVQYKLMSYGIKFPFLIAGSGRDEEMLIHNKFIKERVRIEEEEKQKQDQFYRETMGKKGVGMIVPYPDVNDVLVGRGAPYQTYSGNIMLGEIIENQFLDKYSQITDRFAKSLIHIDVVKAIQEVHGGRFVERTPKGWKIVDDAVARKKVHSSFRSKMAKHPSALKKTELGKKVKQPVSTMIMTPAATTNNPHYYNNNNNALMSWGFGDTHTKRARYDPNMLMMQSQMMGFRNATLWK